MNKFIALIALIFYTCMSFAQTPFKGSDYIYYYQVGIGKTNGTLTNPSAWLEIGKDSTNKGVRIPRVVDTANIIAPVYGLQVYQIKDNGMYFRDKTGWRRMADGGTLTAYLRRSDSTVYYPYWSNPRGFISNELDPNANSKTIRWQAGTGINVSNSSAQALSTNPTSTISAQNTSALWNANQLQGIPISSTAPINGQVLQFTGSQYIPFTPPPSGTVTSVGLALPSSIFNISGSPVTSSGTLSGSLKSQLANTFFSSPDGISGVPAFRSLTNTDLPNSGITPATYGADSLSAIISVNSKGILTNIVNVPIAASWDSVRRKPNSGNYIFNQSLSPQFANMYISGNGFFLGRVGIGSNAPSYKLGVRDTSTSIYKPVVTNNNRPPGVGVNVFNASNTDSVGTYLILSGQSASNRAQQSFIGSVTSTIGFNPHFIIGQSDSDTSYTERIRIDNQGRMGIAMTAPAERLHVGGNIVASAPAYSTGGFTPLVRNNTTGRFETGSVGGSGTVTSVGLSMPAEFSVSNSPVTSSGTLSVSKTTQSANTVYAGPASGAAAVPSFRALSGNDIPLFSPGTPTFTPNGNTVNILGTGYTVNITGNGDAMRVVITTGTGITTTGTIGTINFVVPYANLPYTVYSASDLNAVGTTVAFSATSTSSILVSNKTSLAASTAYNYALITHR